MGGGPDPGHHKHGIIRLEGVDVTVTEGVITVVVTNPDTGEIVTVLIDAKTGEVLPAS